MLLHKKTCAVILLAEMNSVKERNATMPKFKTSILLPLLTTGICSAKAGLLPIGFRLVLGEKFYSDSIATQNAKNNGLTAKDSELLLQISSDHNKLLLLSLVFTIFASLLVYFLIKSRHKRERFLEGYITETRIAKKVHDEIANELYGTISYLASDNNIPPNEKEKLLSRLDSIYLMTKNISRETNDINTGYDFPEHLKMMLTSYSGTAVNIILKGFADVNWNDVDSLKKIATYRSLQELMVNMKKHSQASLVVIDFTVNGKKIVIKYTDNGTGASKEQLFTKNGLLNVENRITAVNGNLEVTTGIGKGFHITLTYPAYTTTYV